MEQGKDKNQSLDKTFTKQSETSKDNPMLTRYLEDVQEETEEPLDEPIETKDSEEIMTLEKAQATIKALQETIQTDKKYFQNMEDFYKRDAAQRKEDYETHMSQMTRTFDKYVQDMTLGYQQDAEKEQKKTEQLQSQLDFFNLKDKMNKVTEEQQKKAGFMKPPPLWVPPQVSQGSTPRRGEGSRKEKDEAGGIFGGRKYEAPESGLSNPPPATEEAIKHLSAAFANLTQHMGDQGKSKLPTLDTLDAEKYINFRTSAETQKAIFQWSSKQAKTQVLRAISGPAAPLVKELAETVRDESVTWEDFVKRLDQIFVPLENSTLAIQQQRAAKQGERESVSVWHARCKAVYLRAFPGAKDDDRHLIYTFVSGLNHRRLREGILQQNPQEYSRALVVANTIYAALVQSHPHSQEAGAHAIRNEEDSEEDIDPSGGINMMQKPNNRPYVNKGRGNQMSRGCFVCGRTDHNWRQCPYYEKIRRLMRTQSNVNTLRSNNGRGGSQNQGYNRGYGNSNRNRGSYSSNQNNYNRNYVQRNNPKRTAAIGDDLDTDQNGEENEKGEEEDAQAIPEDLEKAGVHGMFEPLDDEEAEAIEEMTRFLEHGWQEPNPQ